MNQRATIVRALQDETGFIDGRWELDDNGTTIGVICPSGGSVLGTLPNMGAAETDRAIASAQPVLPAWSTLTGHERSSLLRKWFDLVITHREDLAQLLTAEQGKPLAEARREIDFGVSFIEWSFCAALPP